MSEAEFAAWLRQHLRTVPPARVQEPRTRYAAKRKPAVRKAAVTRRRSRS